MKNKKLRRAMFDKEVTQKETAAKMGINAKVFQNKINQRTVNGYLVRFTVAEKVWLACEFGINENDID